VATDDERDRVEETPSVDSSAKPARESTPPDAADKVVTGGTDAPDSTDDDDDELEIDDLEALDRATEQVSDADVDDDDLVEEPTNAELIALTEPVDHSAGDDADEAAGDRELVEVGAAAGRAGAKAKGSKQAEKKGRATPKRDSGAVAHKRTGPVTFVKESVGELRKVVYPTGPQLLNYFIVVLIFVLFIIAVVSVLDLAFGWAILKIFA
jgi:preprotein translocase subunit SecE